MVSSLFLNQATTRYVMELDGVVIHWGVCGRYALQDKNHVIHVKFKDGMAEIPIGQQCSIILWAPNGHDLVVVAGNKVTTYWQGEAIGQNLYKAVEAWNYTWDDKIIHQAEWGKHVLMLKSGDHIRFVTLIEPDLPTLNTFDRMVDARSQVVWAPDGVRIAYNEEMVTVIYNTVTDEIVRESHVHHADVPLSWSRTGDYLLIGKDMVVNRAGEHTHIRDMIPLTWGPDNIIGVGQGMFGMFNFDDWCKMVNNQAPDAEFYGWCGPCMVMTMKYSRDILFWNTKTGFWKITSGTIIRSKDSKMLIDHKKDCTLLHDGVSAVKVPNGTVDFGDGVVAVLDGALTKFKPI